MTGSAGRSTAMARHPLAVALVILAMVAAGECLNCFVCIPPVQGGKAEQKEASMMRANISRTFENKAEQDFQVCGQDDMSKQPGETPCPWDDNEEYEVVCLDISSGEAWRALTCGRTPFGSDMQCSKCCGGATVCPYIGKARSGAERGPGASAALLVALLSAALTAGW